MATESAADRLAFFDTDEFGVTATIDAASVQGILDNQYVEANRGGLVVESNAPVFICRTADIPAAIHGDTVTISGTAYPIVEIRPDGDGITELVLREPS